ncbi:cyclic GMP-AMP synthase [Mastacembelus armatus]|uniref:Cyclic GMP-AMP synthase a n=1 Tax=Mastacembelus armatus TaxID=205130 RepID=A0A3Q3MYJ4_9TELE|nr:cyclic GMP-AMP synthase-like [Mastacembelus armatus]
MTGRGRPSRTPKAKCTNSNTRPKKTEKESQPRCSEKYLTEEKPNDTTKEQKPKEGEKKKANHTEEKPSFPVLSEQKETTKHFTETNKKPKTNTGNTKATVQGTKAKTCAGKYLEQSIEETVKLQPERPKDTKMDSLKTTKEKRCQGKAKSLEHFSEGMTETMSVTLQDTTKASINATATKTHGRKAKKQVKFAEETKSEPQTLEDTANGCIQITRPITCTGKSPEPFAKDMMIEPETHPKKASVKTTKAKTSDTQKTQMEPETPEHTTVAYVQQNRHQDRAAVDTILCTTLEKLKIKRNDRSNASEVINKIVKTITEHLKKNTDCFKEVEEPLHTGSYYENVKISHPDEFDVMLPIPVKRVTIKEFRDDGAFYSVELKRDKSLLEKFQSEGTLSASKMLKEFRGEVKKCVKTFPEWKVTKKTKGCPAVTLTTEVESVSISLDVVLCLMVKSSWPHFTKNGLKIEGWLGTKTRTDYKRQPYYLVPKYEGRGTVESDGVLAKDVWRVSFSHIEKTILKNHGSEKTCCEREGERCCRKDCLKLLKHLLSLLKKEDSSFEKFCSYHAKTTLLHACCSRIKDTEWKASNLTNCFELLLEDFVGYLEKGKLNNFFIPSQNLLSNADQKSCKGLARCIREECKNGFPIFQQ